MQYFRDEILIENSMIQKRQKPEEEEHTHKESDKWYLLMFHIIVLISVSIVVNKVL